MGRTEEDSKELSFNKPDKTNGNPKYRLSPDEVEVVNNYRRITFEAKEQGIDPKDIKHGWVKSKDSSLFFKNPLFDNGGLSIDKIEKSIQELVDKLDFKRREVKIPKSTNKKAIKITISDSHVGMNPNKNGLFKYEYNADIYKESLDKVYLSILKEHKVQNTFDLLLLDDLGDLADGWNGYTTRGGHKLPQNLSNAEVFNTCVEEKVQLVKRLVESKVAKKIILRCITNDNHSGDFGQIINIAIQKIINLMYNKNIVEVDILTKFIEHRTYGKHCFLLTHGKDKEQMKGGLPIVLNDKAIRLISDYIEHYEIDSKYIHVEKGDLHQIGYQKVKRFDYRNFMSFAPPSSWIQHNFGDSYSGYSIQVIPKETNEISHTDYFLDYKKTK